MIPYILWGIEFLCRKSWNISNKIWKNIFFMGHALISISVWCFIFLDIWLRFILFKEIIWTPSENLQTSTEAKVPPGIEHFYSVAPNPLFRVEIFVKLPTLAKPRSILYFHVVTTTTKPLILTFHQGVVQGLWHFVCKFVWSN